jgi:hypothetical protein
MTKDDLDKRWDRAGFACEGAFAEMDEFLKRCEVEGAPAEEDLRTCLFRQRGTAFDGRDENRDDPGSTT